MNINWELIIDKGYDDDELDYIAEKIRNREFFGTITIIEGDYIMLDDKHWTLAANNRHKKDIHAVRCGCKSCRGTLTELFETVENSGGKVITYDKDNPEDFKDKVTNIFESFKK